MSTDRRTQLMIFQLAVLGGKYRVLAHCLKMATGQKIETVEEIEAWGEVEFDKMFGRAFPKEGTPELNPPPGETL